MKRAIAIFLILALAAGLWGCKSAQQEGAAQPGRFVASNQEESKPSGDEAPQSAPSDLPQEEGEKESSQEEGEPQKEEEEKPSQEENPATPPAEQEEEKEEFKPLSKIKLTLYSNPPQQIEVTLAGEKALAKNEKQYLYMDESGNTYTLAQDGALVSYYSNAFDDQGNKKEITKEQAIRLAKEELNYRFGDQFGAFELYACSEGSEWNLEFAKVYKGFIKGIGASVCLGKTGEVRFSMYFPNEPLLNFDSSRLGSLTRETVTKEIDRQVKEKRGEAFEYTIDRYLLRYDGDYKIAAWVTFNNGSSGEEYYYILK